MLDGMPDTNTFPVKCNVTNPKLLIRFLGGNQNLHKRREPDFSLFCCCCYFSAELDIIKILHCESEDASGRSLLKSSTVKSSSV